MDSAFQLCSIKNIICVPSESARKAYLDTIYQYNIDCYVTTIDKVDQFKDVRIIFIACYRDTEYDNMIIDDILLESSPKHVAGYIQAWFGQFKLRKMRENLSFRFRNRREWLKKITN